MSDKHSVKTDALETLGTIIDASQKRDAIHLAVEPVVAGCLLRAGQRIGFNSEGKAFPVSHITKYKTLGIVDPFITGIVQPGERFWLVVLPRQISSLRHVWEHPEFPDSESPEPDSGLARVVLEAFAGSSSELSDYKRLMDALGEMAEHGCVYGTTCYDEIPDKIWDAYEVVTGKKVADRPAYFSCTC